MKVEILGQVGEALLGEGVSTQPFRQGKTGEAIVSELHGRYYEQAARGNVFSIGCALTALASTTILLTSSAQPIVGIWNPLTSGVNVAILQAMLTDQLNATTTVGLGYFAWASSVGNSALSAGLDPFNRKNLTSNGSQIRAFALSTASLLTGLTNNLVVFEAAEFAVASALATTTSASATPTPSVVGVQNFDGSLIVPPGGVLALVNTVSVTTHSVAARLIWEEIKIPS